MEIVDYYAQGLSFGDLLEEKGVSLSDADKLEVRRHLYKEIRTGDVPKQTVNLGNWSVIIEGEDEAVNLMMALGGVPEEPETSKRKGFFSLFRRQLEASLSFLQVVGFCRNVVCIFEVLQVCKQLFVVWVVQDLAGVESIYLATSDIAQILVDGEVIGEFKP